MTLQRLELQSIFQRLDISPSVTHRRSPLVRTAAQDITPSVLRVPITTSIPGEQEAADFVTALITHQPSPYKRTILGVPALLDFKAEQILKEIEQTMKGREFPTQKIVEFTEAVSLKSEAQRFWRENISEEKAVRWDQFEEDLLLFLNHCMITSLGNIRKVDWSRFFRVLCDILSFTDAEEKEWPTIAGISPSRKGRFRRVSERDWTNFVASGSLNHTILMAIDKEKSHYFSELYQGCVPSKAFVYGSSDTYQGQWRLSKRHGQGLMRFSATLETYSGQFRQGMREGYGVLQGVDSLYKGDWKQDRAHGYGVFNLNGTIFRGLFQAGEVKNGSCVWEDGRTYEGEWQNSQFYGFGKHRDIDGTVSVGQWKDGKLHGTATKTTVSGEVYDGEWLAGVMDGEGRVDLKDISYKGSFIAGFAHGRGEQVWKATGQQYSGQWESGEMNGEGRLLTATGDIFEGTFSHGELTSGKIYFKDGSVYHGEIKNLEMHGTGKIIYVLGSKCKEYSGEFVYSQREGQGVAWYSDGTEYRGMWRKGDWHGKGVKIDSRGKYEGDFANGVYEGKGELNLADGSSYKGSFSNEKYSGFGELRGANGVVKRGFFEAGEIIGLL